MHLILAFLVGCLHNYGYFLWFKKEWCTYGYWRRRLFGAPAKKKRAVAANVPDEGGCCASGGCSGGGGGEASDKKAQ